MVNPPTNSANNKVSISDTKLQIHKSESKAISLQFICNIYLQMQNRIINCYIFSPFFYFREFYTLKMDIPYLKMHRYIIKFDV